jgi:hypothetical protein
MACANNGGGCRVCPASWIAAAVLLFMLVHSFIQHLTAEPATVGTPPSAQQLHEAGKGTE